MTKDDDKLRSELLRKLLAQDNKIKILQINYHYNNSGMPTEPYDLLSALGLSDDMLSDVAKAALEAIEEMVTETSDSDWQAFLWRLSAFLHIQDIFDMKVRAPEHIEIMAQQYYFYYESRLVLAESVLAGLNGLYNSADALLRTFLEFSLLQNYYHRISEKSECGYTTLQNYFKKNIRRHPSWNTVLLNSLPSDPLCQIIRFRVKTHLDSLSETKVHPYHPDFSPRNHRSAFLGHSLEGICFWQLTKLILEAALWVYYANYPLLFHPVEIIKKFGFAGPIGVLIDFYTNGIIKNSLSSADYEKFREYSLRDENTHCILKWAESRKNLTDKEIEKTWDGKENGPLNSIIKGYAMQMYKLRSMRMACALTFPKNKDEEISDETLRKMEGFEGWRRMKIILNKKISGV